MKKWTKQHRQRFQETLAAKKAALAHPPAASGGEAREHWAVTILKLIAEKHNASH